ncbi:hypothetical protein [Bdellovibrio sp. HCB288]|uniref:hypothetical protein n=1 Tax=Bdellovibrio sp. HCB288 TaxID=3394355 RepID=UPI0039B5081E
MKSPLLHKILVLGLCLSVGACAFKKEDAEDKQRQELADEVTKQMQEDHKNGVVVLKPSNTSVEFVELEEPGYYQMVVKWPEEVGSMEIYINGTHQKTISGHNTFKYDTKHNQKIKLVLRAYAPPAHGGAFQSQLERDDLVSPPDYIVSRTGYLESELIVNANRVYFLNGAQLYTNGHDLRIKTKRLYVEELRTHTGIAEDNSHIVTFNQKTLGKIPLEFQNSNISIESDYAQGKLYVAMIGVNGTDGRDAIDLISEQGRRHMSQPAAAGKNGDDGVLSKMVPCHGKHCSGAQEPRCITNPTSGSDGANGLSGSRGEDGSKGGSTGNLSVKVIDHSNFSLDVFQKPGKGGRKGKGNPGQVGGPGGAPGNHFHKCATASHGKKGQDGAPGADGKDGEDGQLGMIDTNVRVTIGQ